MLQQLREHSSKWYIKAFLGFIALCFVILGGGVGDILGGRGGAHEVARVGKKSISDQEFYRALKSELHRLESMLGAPILPDQVQQLKIDRMVLNHLVQETWLDQETDRLQLAISDAQVQKFISQNKSFQDDKGNFNPQLLQRVLEGNHLTEASFVAKVKTDMKRAQLVEALVPPVPMPTTMAEPLYSWENETREIEFVTIKTSAMLDFSDHPDENTLQDFYDKHPSQFALPESRDLSVTLITKENDKDSAIKDAYEKSQKLEDELASGSTLEEAAKKFSLPLIKLSDVTKNGKTSTKHALSEELMAAVTKEGFEASEGSESPLNEAKDGTYYVVHVDTVKPQQTQPFKEAKSKVEELWRLSKKQDAARKLAATLEQETKAGKPLRSLATAQKLSFKVLPAVTRNDTPKEKADIPAKLRQILFSKPLKTPVVAPDTDGFIVAQAVSKNNPTPSKDSKGFETFRNEQRHALGEDIITSYLQALEVRYPVQINEKTLEAIIKHSN